MKDKNVAGILALFFGWIGIHRFYLGQVGLGILYALLFWSGISMVLGLIDAIVFFSMDKDAFDIKYNPRFFRAERRENPDFERKPRTRDRSRRRPNYARPDFERRNYARRASQRHPGERRQRRPQPVERPNPHKASGIKKYRDYDYDGAIEDFERALEIDSRDVAVHFNLACAYSLNENTQKSLFHLDKAVAHGFDDFERIQNHDALAFLRIQPEFEEFRQNAYALVRSIEAPDQETMALELEDPDRQETQGNYDQGDDLLDQLRKLGELRDKGLLTEEEFSVQKKKLLN